jgi:hypothetical protein
MLDPIIRAFMAGLIFLGSNHATVVEERQEREPGTVACPFTAPEATAQEIVVLAGGRTFCAWRIDAPDLGDEVIRVTVQPGTAVAAARAWHWEPTQMVQLNHLTPTPCDVDLSGSFNVNDFTAFLNQPYDWNGDGRFNVLDFVGLGNQCR